MDEPSESDAVERIEAAIARIEAAARAKAFTTDAVERRHAALRERMTEAIAALDEVIAREGTGESWDR